MVTNINNVKQVQNTTNLLELLSNTNHIDMAIDTDNPWQIVNSQNKSRNKTHPPITNGNTDKPNRTPLQIIITNITLTLTQQELQKKNVYR